MFEINLLEIFKLVCLVLFFLWAYITIKIYRERQRFSHIPGPKTQGILGFYIGNLAELTKVEQKGKLLADKYVEWHEQYGPVFKCQLGGDIFVNTSDRQLIKDLFITKNYPKTMALFKRVMFPYNQRFCGYGLSSDPDEVRWRHRRALYNTAFHRNILMSFVGQFNSISDILVEKLTKLADGKTPVNLFNEINQATLDAIALIAFGMQIDSINDKDSPFNRTISECMRIVYGCIIDPLANFNPSKYKDKKSFIEMNKFLRESGKKVILERINQIKNHEINPKNDILTSILETSKDDSIDLEIMIDDFITFFIAGQETTANSLGFCFLEIAKNPEILKKAQGEINEILGERTEVTYDDITKLKYCASIFKEALRLFPPVPLLARYINEDIKILDYDVPKNSTVCVSTYMNARLEKYFPDPYTFKPERFMIDSDTMEGHLENYTYFPFSLGPKNCIGQNFAKIEGIIMIAKFLQRFDYKLDPNQQYIIEQRITIRPRDGARSFLTLRT